MKHFSLLTMILLLEFNSYGQNCSVDKLLEYYRGLSLENILLAFEKEHKKNLESIYHEIEEHNKELNFDKEFFNFRQGTPILVLETYLSKAITDYQYADDISDYFELSHYQSSLALVSKKDAKLIAFIKQDSLGIRILSKDEDRVNRQYIKNLSKVLAKAINENPDAIIINRSLGLLTKSPFLIIIKNSRMYTFTKYKTKPIELNDFVKRHLNEDRVRSLSKWSDAFSDSDLIITR